MSLLTSKQKDGFCEEVTKALSIHSQERCGLNDTKRTLGTSKDKQLHLCIGQEDWLASLQPDDYFEDAMRVGLHDLLCLNVYI